MATSFSIVFFFFAFCFFSIDLDGIAKINLFQFTQDKMGAKTFKANSFQRSKQTFYVTRRNG